MAGLRGAVRAVLLAGTFVAFPPAIIEVSAQQSSAEPFTSEPQLDKALVGTPAERLKAADYVIANPDAVNPFYYAAVINTLWRRGDRAQATFWYYIFQSRSRAWADASPDLAELRGSLNDGMGQTINQWAASDLAAWHDIGARAISYEKKIPLYAGRPDGYSQEKWAAAVAQRRKDYQDGFTAAFSATQADPKIHDEQRRKNGLYVGPLQEPGTPLPDAWR